MIQNPFLSKTFKTIWLKHFNYSKGDFMFNFIPNLAFVKNKYLPIYCNTGKNNTKGIHYSFSNEETKDYKGRVFIIFDIPNYLNIKTPSKNNKIGLHKITQYPGYKIDLEGYSSLQAYKLDVISKKSRYKFKTYAKKINSLVNINSKVYYGNIDDKTYEFVFNHFKTLLRKRFFSKKTNNNNLSPQEWAFYKEVTLPMILNKEAALFVTYDKDIPIAINLVNFSETTMYDVIRVFDIDYAKYRLGVVGIMKQIEWCIENGFKALDFSKGYFDYKKRWANQPYWLEYHIYYDKKSLFSCLIALAYKQFYTFKLFLRRHDLINYVHKLLFFRNKQNM